MDISLVYAVTSEGVIGDGNRLPAWKLKNDMKRFKDLTMGHHIVMGRKTYESIPDRFRPLPGRTNIVITRNPDKWKDEFGEDVVLMSSIDDAIKFAKKNGEEELFIIGGGQIYNEFIDNRLKDVKFIYETLVHGEGLSGDTTINSANVLPSNRFEVIEDNQFPIDDDHTHEYSFRTYKNFGNKITEVELCPLSQMSGTELKVVGIQTPQVQFRCEEDGVDGYVDLARSDARNLAEAIVSHCDEADVSNGSMGDIANRRYSQAGINKDIEFLAEMKETANKAFSGDKVSQEHLLKLIDDWSHDLTEQKK